MHSRYYTIFLSVFAGLIAYAFGYPSVTAIASVIVGVIAIEAYDKIAMLKILREIREIEIQFDADVKDEIQRCRYFVDGPEGLFYSKTAEEAEQILTLLKVDREDWTITDIQNPTGAVK